MKHLLALIFLGSILLLQAHAQTAMETATFAGGCFWCMEEPFEKLAGVTSVTSGFSGGGNTNTSYKEVSGGKTGHMEVVEIKYDPSKISYEELLRVFWRNIDPADSDGQFCDRGTQYRSAIFYHTEQQKALAEKSLASVEAQLHKTPVTPIVPAGRFIAAEQYHQDFYKTNALRYKQYKIKCQRERRLREIWGNEEKGA